MKINITNLHSAARHIDQLDRLVSSKVSPIEVFSKLRRLEKTMSRKACDYCNGDMSREQWEKAEKAAIKKICAMLPYLEPEKIYINGDPRGYALKLTEGSRETISYQDWGGYSILAPEF